MTKQLGASKEQRRSYSILSTVTVTNLRTKMLLKIQGPSKSFYLFVISIFFLLYSACIFTVFQSSVQSNLCNIQAIEGFHAQRTNTIIIGNITTEEISPEIIQKPQYVPTRPEEKVRRILWWSTIYGGDAGFFTIGCSDDELLSLAKNCKVKCEFTCNKTLVESSHGVVFHGWGNDLPTETVEIAGKNVSFPKNAPPERYNDQIYIYFTLEAAPRIRADMEAYRDFFNWTITYRLDSDFVITYGFLKRKSVEEIESYQPVQDGIVNEKLTNRSNLVAWMVSNCDDAPSGRSKLVEELQKYIDVRTYGKCGDNQCNSSVHPNCWEELAMSHKFYLSFENSLCKDYVTEKFFNAISSKMVPIVYGKANYGFQFAPGSFINVDSFPSAKALAHYLLYLNENDEEYLKYFEWRKYYSLQGYWAIQEALCGACERLYENPQKPAVLDVNDWLFRNNSEHPVCVEPPAKF